MIVQIKKRGDSKVIILPKDFLAYMGFSDGDYIDISDIVKANNKNRFMSEDD